MTDAANNKNLVSESWELDADGVPHREASRVIIRRGDGAVYLIHGHDIDDTEHSWWFTVGGGLDGDTPVEGARRELFEETGLRVESERFVGPVLERSAQFHFVHETRRQDEHFYLLDVSADEAASARGGYQLTELEKQLLDDFRWWTPDEIEAAEAAGETFYPVGLVRILRALWPRWNGVLLQQTEE